MNKYQLWLTAILSSFFSLTLVMGLFLVFERAKAAPSPQIAGSGPIYLSISGLAFLPTNASIPYSKDTTRQLLSLTGQNRNFNLFIVPVNLPDQSVLTGMTVFGEDFDNQGAVQLRLKRCEQSQGVCISLTDATSTNAFAVGRFETVRVPILNEVINNNLYTYFLELELSALNNSGLRSVRLELFEEGQAPPPTGNTDRWELSCPTTRLTLTSGTGARQVRVCTDNLSDLPNITHYPSLVVNDQVTRLSSNNCITVQGSTIEVRRPYNTGPSSGTYQILR
jgi:hypothetical protein